MAGGRFGLTDHPEKTLAYIDQQISEVEADDCYHYKSANIQTNAPLALIQVDLKAKMRALQSVKSILLEELEATNDQNTTTLYLVWNQGKSECVGFNDETDAKFASTGDHKFGRFGYSSLAGDFRELYEDEADEQDFEIQKIELEN